jgi:hypothetical protein
MRPGGVCSARNKNAVKLVSVVPSLKPDVDEVTYRCSICDKEFTRSVRASLWTGHDSGDVASVFALRLRPAIKPVFVVSHVTQGFAQPAMSAAFLERFRLAGGLFLDVSLLAKIIRVGW